MNNNNNIRSAWDIGLKTGDAFFALSGFQLLIGSKHYALEISGFFGDSVVSCDVFLEAVL